MAARLVQIGPRIEMAGGLLPFDFETSEAVLKALYRSSKKVHKEAGKLGRGPGLTVESAPNADALSDSEMLRASTFMFTNIWLDRLLQRTLNPRLPQMSNTDGEEIAFTTITYPLKPEAGIEPIRAALNATPSLRPENETFWNWIGHRPPAGKRRGDSQTFITTLDDGSLVLGTIELKEKTIVLEANSQQRAERGGNLLAPILGGLVGEPIIETRSVAELMASRPAGKSEKLSSGLSPDEERAVIQANMDLHYLNLLDERVPMLGNVTPRRAAKSAKGREKLVTWLKLLENGIAKHESGSSMADYDVTPLWKELGVMDLRR